MNWGKGIIGGMIIFMLFIIGMGIYMFAAPADDYDHQYYEKGLTFNSDYDKEQLVFKDKAQPAVRILDKVITFTFSAPAKAKIGFMRPSDTHLDRIYELTTGESNRIIISRNNIPIGEWQITVDWESNKHAYLYKQKLYIK